MNRDPPGHPIDHLPNQRDEANLEAVSGAQRVGEEHKLLAILAHDLRNRVAPMRNAVHLIRLHATTDPVLQSMVEILERQINGMVRLLEAIVDADRINRGELVLTRSEVDLAALIASAVQLEQPLLDGRKQQVSVTLPRSTVRLQADRERLTRVLATLLETVRKDTDEGENILLEAAIVGDEVRIRMRNSGLGMTAEPLLPVSDSLAGSLQPASLQPTSGAALELAVACSLIELHRGRIETSSGAVDLARELVICLPVLSSENNDSAPEQTDVTTRAGMSRASTRGTAASGTAPTQPGDRRRRVLIADDSPAVRASLSALLRDLGHDVEAAGSGAEAIERAQQWAPEFMLLDIHMPDMSGFAVARQLRAQFPPDVMRLVMMSGTTLDETTREGAKQAGFDHCIDKVFSLAALERVLSSDNPT